MKDDLSISDDAEFIRGAVHHICGSLDIGESMVRLLCYLRRSMPVSSLVLERYDTGCGSMRGVVIATPEGVEYSDVTVRLSHKSRAMIREIFRGGVPAPYYENNPGGNPAAVELLSHYPMKATAFLSMPIGTYNHEPGGIVLLTDSGEYTDDHLRLISQVREPVEIAMTNALQHAELIDLKNRLARDNRQLYAQHVSKYLALRKSVGIIGILLPFVLMFGNFSIFKGEFMLPSISRYYYSGMHDVFVASLCAIALFLFFYSGIGRRERFAGFMAGLFALGVVFFPTSPEGALSTSGIIHYACAILLFVNLAVFALYMFPRKLPGVPRRLTDRVQIACGILMLACIGALIIYFAFFVEDDSSFVFVVETIALVAFGVSWITEGFDIEYGLQ